MDLGFELGLPQAMVFNIRDDYKTNKHKGLAVLKAWMDKDGNNATIGHLAGVLDKIGKKNIADGLLGMSSYQCVNQAL